MYLKNKNKYAGVLVVTIRYSDFKTYNHQIKLNNNINSYEEIYKYSKEIFNKLWNGEPVRLIGLRVDNLENKEEVQLSFFSNDTKQEKIDNVLDDLKNKYGYNSITRAGKLEIQEIIKGKEKKIK